MLFCQQFEVDKPIRYFHFPFSTSKNIEIYPRVMWWYLYQCLWDVKEKSSTQTNDSIPVVNFQTTNYVTERWPTSILNTFVNSRYSEFISITVCRGNLELVPSHNVAYQTGQGSVERSTLSYLLYIDIIARNHKLELEKWRNGNAKVTWVRYGHQIRTAPDVCPTLRAVLDKLLSTSSSLW